MFSTRSTDDGWDWRYIYYLGTVVLRMSDEVFWRTQPKRLVALLHVHEKMQPRPLDNTGTERLRRTGRSGISGRSRFKSSRPGFIDQVL